MHGSDLFVEEYMIEVACQDSSFWTRACMDENNRDIPVWPSDAACVPGLHNMPLACLAYINYIMHTARLTRHGHVAGHAACCYGSSSIVGPETYCRVTAYTHAQGREA